MGRVIAVANQKGGVAKTTTAVNLGIGLAREGKSVLFVDTDPQGSLTASLGYMEPDEIPITLANVLTAVINEEEIDPAGGILHHEEDIDIMPGNIELSALEVVMGNVMSRELILKRKTAMVSWWKIPRWSGDKKKIRHCMYYCTAARPTIEGKTNEDSKEVQTESLEITATPLPSGLVKVKTGANTTDEVYNGWYSAVYQSPTTEPTEQGQG